MNQLCIKNAYEVVEVVEVAKMVVFQWELYEK